MREPPPLAAAPATERSERVGEEAEFLCQSDLSTYAPVFLSARGLTRPPGLSAGENAHGQAATAFASPFMVPCRTAPQFSSNVRLWLLMNRAMLSAVCCCLFTFSRLRYWCLRPAVRHLVITPGDVTENYHTSPVVRGLREINTP